MRWGLRDGDVVEVRVMDHGAKDNLQETDGCNIDERGTDHSGADGGGEAEAGSLAGNREEARLGGLADGNLENGVAGGAEGHGGSGQDAHTAEEIAGDPRYDVDAMLATYGLNWEDMKNPAAALVSGGLRRLWAVARVMQLNLIAKVRAARERYLNPKSDYEKALEEEMDPRDPRLVAEFEAWAAREDARPHKPIWQIVSGLGGADERDMSPDQRDECINVLLDVVSRLATAELEKQAASPRPERSYLWDPLPQICFYLGIARARLSRYSKEATGMAAHEVVDRMRAAGVKEAIRSKLLEAKGKIDGLWERKLSGRRAGGLEFWKALRESRQTPEWNRETWAIGLGFANYRRLYRACLLYYGVTPTQLEYQVVCEICGERLAGELMPGSAAPDGRGEDGKRAGTQETHGTAGAMQEDVQFFKAVTAAPGPLNEKEKMSVAS